MGDLVSRRSISIFIIYVSGVPVSWMLKVQENLILSSSEADWITMSEVFEEVIFIIQFLESMKISGKLPIMVSMDNVGALFMASNVTTMS